MPRRRYPKLRPPGLVPIEEAAELLGLKRRAFFIYRSSEPDFPQPDEYKEGKRIFYRKIDIEAWRDRRR